jgi:hypothetical protein
VRFRTVRKKWGAWAQCFPKDAHSRLKLRRRGQFFFLEALQQPRKETIGNQGLSKPRPRPHRGRLKVGARAQGLGHRSPRMCREGQDVSQAGPWQRYQGGGGARMQGV